MDPVSVEGDQDRLTARFYALGGRMPAIHVERTDQAELEVPLLNFFRGRTDLEGPGAGHDGVASGGSALSFPAAFQADHSQGHDEQTSEGGGWSAGVHRHVIHAGASRSLI